MAIIVKIDLDTIPTGKAANHFKERIDEWGDYYGIGAFVSVDHSYIITDLHADSLEFKELLEILRRNAVKFTAIGNIDIAAIFEAANNNINNKQGA